MLRALGDDAERSDSARQGGHAAALAGRAHEGGIATIRHEPCSSISHRRGRTVDIAVATPDKGEAELRIVLSDEDLDGLGREHARWRPPLARAEASRC